MRFIVTPGVELYAKVRHAVRIEGLSERAAARRFGIDSRTVAKMVAFSVPPGYRRTKPPVRPKLDAFIAIIERILAEDRNRPKKQRHTAKRIFERLRDEHGFAGGITIVKDYVAGWRQRAQEMFVPLAHPPGHAQVDFGEAIASLVALSARSIFRVRPAALRCLLCRGAPLALDQLLLRQSQQETAIVDAFGTALPSDLVVLTQEGRHLQGLEVVGEEDLGAAPAARSRHGQAGQTRVRAGATADGDVQKRGGGRCRPRRDCARRGRFRRRQAPGVVPDRAPTATARSSTASVTAGICRPTDARWLLSPRVPLHPLLLLR